MIWDTFMVGGASALDLLELRLRTLDKHVDNFVVTEATWDHQGGTKRLALLDAEERFREWHERIRYVPMLRDPGGGTWNRENMQRDNLMWGLRGIEPGDIVLHGDLDEIPDLSDWRLHGDMSVFVQKMHYFAVDWAHPSDTWPGTVAAQWGSFGSFTWLRKQRFELGFTPPAGGGWHFSWLGGEEQIRLKATAMAHVELRAPVEDVAARMYREGFIPWEDRCCVPVDVDETWPDWIARRECPGSWFRPR